MHYKVGNDVRKAVLDGWPAHNAIASDLSKGKPTHIILRPTRLIMYHR